MFSGFPARFSKDSDGGGILVTFPDIPEAITESETLEEAMAEAKDCLLAALGGYVADNRRLPQASKPKRGQRLIQLRPLHAAKLALYQAMKGQKLTRVAFADKLGVSEGAVRRLLDLDHASRLDHVERALEALGKRLVVVVEDAA
jgi:antitoxin HicB